MQIRDVMTTRVITVGPYTEVAEIARCLLKNRISAVPVVETDGHLVGIVSEGDLMRRSESRTEHRTSWWLSLLLLAERRATDYIKTHGRRAQEVMTRALITVNDDASLEEIAEILEKHRIKRVLVIREGKLVGIASRADLLIHRAPNWRQSFNRRSQDQGNHRKKSIRCRCASSASQCRSFRRCG